MSTIKVCLEEIEVLLEYDYSPGDPGQTSGPPERCYPPEPEEVSINTVQIGEFYFSPDSFSQQWLDHWKQEIINHETNKADERFAEDYERAFPEEEF